MAMGSLDVADGAWWRRVAPPGLFEAI